ncbi:MAG: ABC transporter substrate-binding protein [Culicoidibacterales bacterium]
MKEKNHVNRNLLILLVAIVISTASILTLGVGRSGSASSGKGGAGVDTIGNTLKIGLARMNSGPSANYGKHADFGAEMAVEELNKSGRLGNVKIELVKEDTEGQADKAKTAVQKLIKQDNVAAIVGPQASSEVMAAGDIAQESGIPVLSATATNPKATEKGDALFSVAYTDTYQGELLGKYISASGKKRVAFLFNSDNPYSTGGKDAIKNKLLSLGVQVVAEEAFSKGATDFNGQLQRIKSAKPDALVLPEEVGPITPIGPQARAILGKEIPFYGIDGMGGITGTAKGDDFDNSYYVNSFSGDAPTTEVQAFYKKFKEKYNEEPTFVSANTYDAIYVVADAYKYAVNKTPEAMRNEIEKTNRAYVTGRISFSRQRFAIKPVMVVEIKKEDGKLVEKYKETLSAD